jgi:hypothetical protein
MPTAEVREAQTHIAILTVVHVMEPILCIAVNCQPNGPLRLLI